MKRRILSLYRLSLPFATAILALLARPSAQAQSWSGATSGAWLTTTNWTGGVAAGSSTITTDTDIAVFNVAANATVGINMSTTSGVYYLGALDNTNATARTFNNSSTTVAGVLTLNGATVNSVANTILRNSTTTLMTITNGTGAGTLGLGLGNATNNIIQITGTGGITINSIISGTGRNLTRQGTGTGVLTLTGANNYDGVTTITAGTLSINTFTNGGVAGSLGMASNAPANLIMEGGTLSYSGGSTTTDRGMTFSALTGNPIISVSAAATNLTLTNVIAGTAGQQIDFTKGSGGTLTLSNDNNSYIGRTFVSGGTLAVTSISAVGAGNSSMGVATSAANGLISIGTGVTTTTLSYIGTGNTTDRDLNLPGTTGGGIISQSGTGLLKFTGLVTATGAGSKTLTLTGSTAGTGEIAGGIVENSGTNTTSLTKAGTGIWTLSGANIYTGATTVTGGTLDLGGGTATGSLSSPTLTLSGGTFRYTRTGNTTQGFTTTNINGGASSQISVVSGNTLELGAVVRGAGGGLDFSSTGAGTVAALAVSNVNGIMPGLTFGNTWAVANGSGVAISGLASYTLTSVAGTTATNYLNGNIDADNSAGLIDVAITANSLRFNSPAANTVTLAAGSNALTAGGILVNSTVGSNLSTITGGTLTGAANQNLAIIQNNPAGGLTISSSILDNTSTSVTKSGVGLLTIDAANTYTGGTIINAGTVKLSGAGTLGPAGASVAVSSGALLDLNGTNQNIKFTAGIGIGTVANNSGSGTSTLTLGGTATLAGDLVAIADNTNSTSGRVAVVIQANTQPLSNLNTYSGGTTVNAGAFLYLNSATPLGAGTGTINLPASGVSTALSSGLLVDGGTTYANDITGAGYIHNNSGTAATTTLTGSVNTSGNFNVRVAGSGFNFAGSGNSTLSGVIGPAGASGVFGPNTTVSTGVLIKSGTGTLTLSGANLYSGTTTISGGILNANSTSALGSGVAGNTLIFTGGILQAGGTITSPAARTVTLTSNGLIDTNSNAVSIAGIMSGAGGLTKSGLGNLTLTGVNTYTGATAINGDPALQLVFQ